MTAKTLLQRINQHQYLRDLRNKLLHLHRMLLETERINYEQVRGRVSNTELFQLVVADEQFAWLHRISELVVQIDETLSSDQPISLEDVQNLITNTRILIAPSEVGNEFARKYYAALQSEPSVVLAHAAVSELLAIK
ncbi:hypothetical protein [Nostoc sp. PCC 7107]|uniref:hypothetical protein n=1 Tax=Nostoc sp. PCC 7107 TaxID=317936 RepID=UPI00029ED9CC|nr:hypothetical protein [Nostoc sp. PCC 7107]AFY41024.1 hypothetical protein Nos7107_0339 [Nostoc sp. PCC 7107]